MRTRLIVLSLIPVVGFAAIAFAYISSERAVEAAFGSVQQSSRLADASRVFKESLTGMQVSAGNTWRSPSRCWSRGSSDAHRAAMESLKTIRELAEQADKQKLTALQGRVADLTGDLRGAHRRTGRTRTTEFEGIQGGLRDGGNLMERIVNEDMSWLSQADQRKILTPLMLMRRYEVEYRLTRAEPVNSAFKQELAAFEKAFAGIVAADMMKQQLSDQVKIYADAFASWIASTGKISRSTAVISAETRQMLPTADEIIASAGRKAAVAAEGVAASQAGDQATDFRYRIRRGRPRARPQLADLDAASPGRSPAFRARWSSSPRATARSTCPRPKRRTRSAAWRAP